MPAAREVELFLSHYPADVVAQARQLAERRSVRLARNTADVIEAEVALEDDFAHVELHRENGIWRGHAEVEDQKAASVSLCAAILEAEGSAETTDIEPTPARTLRELVEEKLTRQLSATEDSFVSKVQTRYDRFLKTGEIYDHDLVRIHPRWPVETHEPLRLWPELPRDVMTFWNYIAVALLERKLPLPGFLDNITDLTTTRARLEEWRQAEDLPRWMDRIRTFNRQCVAETRTLELRLIVTTSEARFQGRAQSNEPWHVPSDAELREWQQSHSQGSLEAPLSTHLILESSLRILRDEAQAVVRLDDSAAATWLSLLFALDELRPHLLTLDEIPFEHPQTRLQWHVADDETLKPGNPVLLKFCDEAGNDAPRPLRLLPSAHPLYLSSEAVYAGPAPFFETTTVPTSLEMPWAAIAGEEGVHFLEKLGVPLPKSIAGLVRREKFQVELSARCLPREDRNGAEQVAITARATTTDGLITQSLRAQHWELQQKNVPRETAIRLYDRAPLQQAITALEQLHAAYDVELDAFRTRVTRQFPERFLQWAKSLPADVVLDPDSRLRSILADPLKATVRFELEETGIDWFDLRLVFDIEGVQLKPAEIRRLIAARGGFVRLADGSWRSVTLELTDEQREAIGGLGLDLDELSDEAHPLHLRQLAEQRRHDLIPPEVWERVRRRLAKLDVAVKPETPEALKITLRPYQSEGFHFLVYLTINRLGGILADDMGLGKTLQSISWMLWLRKQASESNAPMEPVLVVCPKSVLDVWAVECAKSAPSLRVHVLREKETLDLEAVRASSDVLVINYAQLRACIEGLEKIPWLAAILDEGQQIKNPDSKVARAARRLKAQNRIVLTGTPLENRLLDLWSLMTFATPGALGDRAYFQKHFDRRKDDRAAERLSARLRPFIMRRTKSQVARELPPRTEEDIHCEMTEAQEKMYREHLTAAQQLLLTSTGSDALQKRRFAILQAITRLRQICCHPALITPGALPDDSAKMNALLDLLEQLHDEGHKVLVFSQFVTMLNLIRDRLTELDRPWHYLTGASRNRADIVNGFQDDPKPSVFLLSLKAGGSGLNLTAASYVVLYDPWWNPAVENQAIDRAHRIGQTQPVMAYRLITRNSIEEKIRKLQLQKSLLSSDVLGEEHFTSALDRRDFEYLFDLPTSAGKEEP